ncbi:response regulator [Candidatus Poribacteria bacterium]|nr:response regulator [Candidatus Poribacteria bacterium]
MNFEKILIVDDEEMMREMVTEMLEDQAKEIITAENAEEALEIFNNNGSFDAVLTDLKMPGMNGLQLLESIKGINPSMPVVVMTGYSEIFSVEEAMKSGVDEYILKPFKKDEIGMVMTRAKWRASSIYKRRLLEGVKSMIEYINTANKIIATSGYPSPHKENLMAKGEEIKRSVARNVTEVLKNI